MRELLIRFRIKIKNALIISGLLGSLVALFSLITGSNNFGQIILSIPWVLGLPFYLYHLKNRLPDVFLSKLTVLIWFLFIVGLTFYHEIYLGWIWSLIGIVGIVLIESKKYKILGSLLFLLLNIYHSIYLYFDYSREGGVLTSGWRLGIMIFGIIFFLYFLWVLIKMVILTITEKDKEYKLIKTILDNIPSEIVAIDKEKRHIYVNHTAIKNPELRAFMKGRTVFEYCEFRNKPIELAISRDKWITLAFENKKQYEWEENFESPTGTLTYIQRLSPVKNEEGEPEFLISYGIDITERKKAEAEVKRNQAVQQAINYFAKSLIGQNTEEDIVWDIAQNCIHFLGFQDCIIYLVDPDKKFLVQKAAYGNKSEEGKKLLNALKIPIGKGIVGAAAMTGTSQLVNNTLEDKRYIVDDEKRQSEISVPIIGPQGVIGVIDSEHADLGFYTQNHLEILEVISSICASKLIKARADQALLESKEKAEEATLAKSSFLSTMSHEIRTPINAVIGIAHFLLEDKPKKNQLASLKTLQFSAKHLLSLINDVLDYSKIEAGKLSFEKIEFNLQELMDNLENTFSFKSCEKQLGLIKEITDPVQHFIIGDWVRLNQVLNNLMGNALKFTNKGNVRFGYKLIDEQEDHVRLHFFVSDTGIGIAEDKIKTIFNQFTQASSNITRKYGGTGLGLAISKKLVELQGGEIGLNSTLGAGTTFWFTLSFSKGLQLQSADNNANILSWTEQTLKGMKILLVEDNKVNIMISKKFLQKWKIEVNIAENGQIAYEKVQSDPYDLILMDLNMPVMDGITSTKLIRQLPGSRFTQMPIIALTADISDNVKKDILKSGMNDYLTKPFDPEILFQTLKRFHFLKTKHT